MLTPASLNNDIKPVMVDARLKLLIAVAGIVSVFAANSLQQFTLRLLSRPC